MNWKWIQILIDSINPFIKGENDFWAAFILWKFHTRCEDSIRMHIFPFWTGFEGEIRRKGFLCKLHFVQLCVNIEEIWTFSTFLRLSEFMQFMSALILFVQQISDEETFVCSILEFWKKVSSLAREEENFLWALTAVSDLWKIIPVTGKVSCFMVVGPLGKVYESFCPPRKVSNLSLSFTKSARFFYLTALFCPLIKVPVWDTLLTLHGLTQQ